METICLAKGQEGVGKQGPTREKIRAGEDASEGRVGCAQSYVDTSTETVATRF